ncbi:MAG TPA: hypothetical protein DHU79_06405 [Clostridiales bacterium]|nr:hypothetical protein [Clostridiales bacterium]
MTRTKRHTPTKTEPNKFNYNAKKRCFTQVKGFTNVDFAVTLAKFICDGNETLTEKCRQMRYLRLLYGGKNDVGNTKRKTRNLRETHVCAKLPMQSLRRTR